MAYLRKKEKLERLLQIIEKGNCGDAVCLAGCMGVSIRTIKTYISILRQMGNNIVFDQTTKTYLAVSNESSSAA
jgi:predicted DNA-binding transcriptional regulator YafY